MPPYTNAYTYILTRPSKPRAPILLGRVRNWIEVRFSVMTLSLGLHRIAAFPSGKHLVAQSYRGLVARVNLIRKVASLTLVHNLIRSWVSLRMAGVEL